MTKICLYNGHAHECTLIYHAHVCVLIYFLGGGLYSHEQTLVVKQYCYNNNYYNLVPFGLIFFHT